jgi:UDP-N-acetylglucosamine--N-acetylmuramyl-(pentapeptide) pyrophosphoryl-undecaprenol N-acetylglucosamine transferase
MGKTALLVAGGTGGHLFPALALRAGLVERGWTVHMASDSRAGRFMEGVPAEYCHVIAAATFAGRNPVAALNTVATLMRGLIGARRLLKEIRPDVVVGFGGYPTLPPVIAARLGGVAAIVQDQNMVIGRANRLLIRLGAHLATGFENPAGAAAARAVTHVGNPVRPAVIAASEQPYRAPAPGEPFRLLVFGGSQGASVFSDLLPAAVAALSPDLRVRLTIVQQCREEDLARTRVAYGDLGVAAELATFFTDMAERIAAAHLVISRSGASTVSELAVIGRPAILVPYPHALDHDQAENARALCAAGGGWLMAEADLSPEKLAARLAELIGEPAQLAAAAAAARALGTPQAVALLADLVEKAASGR